jgi:hypothetical protein
MTLEFDQRLWHNHVCAAFGPTRNTQDHGAQRDYQCPSRSASCPPLRTLILYSAPSWSLVGMAFTQQTGRGDAAIGSESRAEDTVVNSSPYPSATATPTSRPVGMTDMSSSVKQNGAKRKGKLGLSRTRHTRFGADFM